MFKLLAFASAAFGADLLAVKEPVEGEFIVVLKQDVDTSAHMEALRGMNVTVMHEYNINKGQFRGYSIKSQKEAVETLLADDTVSYVEENGVVRTGCDGNVQRDLPTGLWGLARTSDDSLSPPTNYDNYLYTNTGQGVTVYVMDTGIRLTHNEFSGRARHEFDATGEGPGDGNGHGTHCASTVGGNTYGVAKDVSLVDVKVLSRFGSGSFAGVIAGVNYAAGTSARPKVGSMSLGGGRSQSVNDAVDAASNAGVTMVVASGNSNTDACNFSPASAPEAITVNSIQRGDQRSSFSNYGQCTEIFAPGSSVLGAWITSDSATNTISGTSMATPHVAGQAAKLLQVDPSMTPRQVKAELDAEALPNVVPNPGNSATPNKLLHGC